jgi:hypothetical protein
MAGQSGCTRAGRLAQDRSLNGRSVLARRASVVPGSPRSYSGEISPAKSRVRVVPFAPDGEADFDGEKAQAARGQRRDRPNWTRPASTFSSDAGALSLPSTIAPHALRHRFPHHDSKDCGPYRFGHEFAGRDPAVDAPKCCRREARSRRDLAFCELKSYLELTSPTSVPCESGAERFQTGGVWRHPPRVFAIAAPFRARHSSRQTATASSQATGRGLQFAASGSCW